MLFPLFPLNTASKEKMCTYCSKARKRSKISEKNLSFQIKSTFYFDCWSQPIRKKSKSFGRSSLSKRRRRFYYHASISLIWDKSINRKYRPKKACWKLYWYAPLKNSPMLYLVGKTYLIWKKFQILSTTENLFGIPIRRLWVLSKIVLL